MAAQAAYPAFKDWLSAPYLTCTEPHKQKFSILQNFFPKIC
jgi:hypothetical protein